MDKSFGSGGRVPTYQCDFWNGDPNQISHWGLKRKTILVKNQGKRCASWKRWKSLPLFSIWLLWPYEGTSPTKPLAFQLSCHRPHPSTLAHLHLLLAYTTPYTVNMGKEPVMARQGTRYEPYSNKSPARRRRGSPPPDRWGIRAGSHHAQLTGGISDLLDDLNTRYGSRDLRELFRDHANQPGALGQAIGTWIQHDEVIISLPSSSLWGAQTGVLLANSLFQIRGPRQPEPTNFLETQNNNQSHCRYVQEPIPGDESRTSQPPVGQPDARHVSFLHDRRSLIIELNSHYRFPPHISTPSMQMFLQLMSVCIVFTSL